MGCVYFLVLSLLCQVVHHAHSAKHQDCPKSFICGTLGSLGYPFTNQSCPRPDSFSVSDCNNNAYKIQLHRGRRKYSFVNISQSDIVLIDDPGLRQSLNSKNCTYFEDLVLPNTSLVSFHVLQNLSMFKCNHSSPLPSEPSSVHANCSDYGYSIYNRIGTMDYSSRCSIIQLPANPNPPKDDDIFSLLSAKFSLQLQIHPGCVLCRRIGGECEYGSKGSFHCAKGNDKFLKLGLGLGLGIGCAFIVAACLVLSITSCAKRKRASTEYILRTNSSNPSTEDLEDTTIHYGVQIFMYNELKQATNHFSESNEIGDGGFGAVYYGRLKDGREVAVKRLYEHNYRRLEQFINEIQILTRLRHKNLVSLYGCTSRRARELLLVYEFIQNGTLAYHLHGEGSKSGCSMAWPVRISIAVETAYALAYLHASDIIHRDVKTDNILLNNNFCVKVADFGLSRLFPNHATHVSTAPQGTPGYVDPEYHRCYRLTDKSDVYSFGVVLIELISSMPAIDISRHGDDINLANLAVNRIRVGDYAKLVDPNLGFDSDKSVSTMILSVAELAFRCLQQDKDMRPDMEEVLENLRTIQSGGCPDTIKVRVLCIELSCDGSEMLKTEMPPCSTGCCDEIGLLKSIRPPVSPNSVTDRWLSSSSAKTNPSM